MVHADCEQLLQSVSGTAQIAASISGKVRTLDLAQSRVAETLSNIKAVLDRTNCINGVQAAMEAAVGQREGWIHATCPWRNRPPLCSIC